MTQTLLTRAVARRTGEDRALITQRGFSLAPTEAVPDADVGLCVRCPGCTRSLPVTADDFGSDPDDEFWADCARCDAAFPFSPDEVRATARAA